MLRLTSERLFSSNRAAIRVLFVVTVEDINSRWSFSYNHVRELKSTASNTVNKHLFRIVKLLKILSRSEVSEILNQ